MVITINKNSRSFDIDGEQYIVDQFSNLLSHEKRCIIQRGSGWCKCRKWKNALEDQVRESVRSLVKNPIKNWIERCGINETRLSVHVSDFCPPNQSKMYVDCKIYSKDMRTGKHSNFIKCYQSGDYDNAATDDGRFIDRVFIDNFVTMCAVIIPDRIDIIWN